MKCNYYIIVLISIVGIIIPQRMCSQQTLTLDDCRKLTLENNEQLKMSNIKNKIAGDALNSTRSLYYPKINLTGSYVHTSKSISILNDEQKNTISNFGTSLASSLSQSVPELLTTLVTQGIITPTQAQGLGQIAAGSIPGLSENLNEVGEKIVDAFRTDTRNVWLGAVTLVQPVYTGGRISNANKIAAINKDLTTNEIEQTQYRLINNTDNAYWLVVSLHNKHKLAESYHELLLKLESDVKKMVAEGVATKSDELSVSVKVNEAEMTLVQVEDGLVLAKKALCNVCGIPLDTEFRLDDEDKDIANDLFDYDIDFQTVLANRPEMKMLRNAEDIANKSISLAKADYLPTIALTAGYTYTNPNLYNGFKRKFGGMWNVGVVLNMPLSNLWENRSKVNMARSSATLAQLKIADASNLIDLQVQQDRYKLSEARKKLLLTEKNISKANENLHSANTGFSEGVFTATTVMEAQTAWLKAKNLQIDAQIEVKLAVSSLHKSLALPIGM